jgi:hypothetical protein
MKTCSKCNELKPFGMFGKNKSRKDGYEYWCKICLSTYYKKNEYNKKWLQSNPEYLHDRYKSKTQLINLLILFDKTIN